MERIRATVVRDPDRASSSLVSLTITVSPADKAWLGEVVHELSTPAHEVSVSELMRQLITRFRAERATGQDGGKITTAAQG